MTFSGGAFASDKLTWGDEKSTSQETQLRWQPYRPEQKAADCKHAACESSGSTARSEKVHQAAGELPTPHSKVHLVAAHGENATPILTDPFDDDPSSSGYQHPISITPEDVETPATSGNPHWRSTRSAPAELHSGELIAPEREVPGRATQVYQSNQRRRGPDPYQSEQLPDLEGSTRQALQNPAEDCRAAYDKIRSNTLDKVNLDITVTGKPGDDVPYECALTTDEFSPRCWQLTTYTWKASALCHKPLYFEEEALERYGHSHGWICEDLVSCAHFFGNVALLPYHVGVETPCECIYDLGVYRPGDCAPYICDPFPISLRGCCTAAVGYGAVIALFP